MRKLKIIACCTVLVGLMAAAPSSFASNRSVPANSSIARIDGPYMLVHEVTGTYLETDGYNDNVNEAVQTWNLDPPQTTPGLRGHKWYLTAGSPGMYHIESFDNRRCLTASAAGASDYPRLQNCDDDARQDWIIRRVFPDQSIYTISPRSHPGYALGIQGNHQLNDRYVVPTPTWGGNPSYSQHWQLVLKSRG